MSARYDDSCVAGSNNRDREGALLQVRATAETTAACALLLAAATASRHRWAALNWRQVGCDSRLPAETWQCHGPRATASATAFMHGHAWCTAAALLCSACCSSAPPNVLVASGWQRCNELHHYGPPSYAPCLTAGTGRCHSFTLLYAWPPFAVWRCTAMRCLLRLCISPCIGCLHLAEL